MPIRGEKTRPVSKINSAITNGTDEIRAGTGVWYARGRKVAYLLTPPSPLGQPTKKTAIAAVSGHQACN